MAPNSQFVEAVKAPAALEVDGKNKVLVRSAMINYFKGLCDDMDKAFAQIPQILEKYGLSDYNKESLHRAILFDGFYAVYQAVENATRDNLKKSGLFPKVAERLAKENADAISEDCKRDIEGLVREINALNKELSDIGLGIRLDAVWFRSGKLRVQPKDLEAIAPRFTIPVSEKDIKTVEKIRQAASLLAELKSVGVSVSDEMRLAPPDNKPFFSPGVISRIAGGSKYDDAELLGFLHGIELTH